MLKNIIALAAASALGVAAFGAVAGEDSTHRYWRQGPAWYDVPCGLPCFGTWGDVGPTRDGVSVRELRTVRSEAEKRELVARSQSERRTAVGSTRADRAR